MKVETILPPYQSAPTENAPVEKVASSEPCSPGEIPLDVVLENAGATDSPCRHVYIPFVSPFEENNSEEVKTRDLEEKQTEQSCSI